MLGSQIAENLRQNRERWIKYRYSFNGQYCVIGLKLHELGVAVEAWEADEEDDGVEGINSESIREIIGDRMPAEQMLLLQELQDANDKALNIEALIDYCESNHEKNYPLEELAQILRGAS